MKAKEAPSPHDVRLAPLDTNPVFQSLGETYMLTQKNGSVMSIKDCIIDALKEENFRLQQKVQTQAQVQALEFFEIGIRK